MHNRVHTTQSIRTHQMLIKYANIYRHNIRTWENKWEPGILINNLREVLVSVIGRKKTFEVHVDLLEWLSGFDKANPLWAVELRLTITANRALACHLIFIEGMW